MDSRLRGNNGKNAVAVIPAKAGIHGLSDQRSSQARKPNTDTVDRTTGPGHGRQRRFFDEVVSRLTELRAGPLGRFEGLVAEPIADGDPLLGPARVWTGRTPYIATRNLGKRDAPASFVEADVLMECRRRGLPSPAEIEVLHVGAGPRGGRPAAMLRLRFATAVRGPILLGRDSHGGGGLFHAGPD